MKRTAPDVVLAIQRELEQFVDECHLTIICYVGAIKSREATQGLLAKVFEDNEPVSITIALSERSTRVQTSVRGEDAAKLFSSEGKFDQLQAKSLVMSIFTHWDSVTRPKIASLLGVRKKEDVESELMGQWRLLRNWLVHRDGDAEEQYFRKADALAQLLDSRHGEPAITPGGVLALIKRLRSLAVIVNPDKLEPFVQFSDLSAEQQAKLTKRKDQRILPLWHEGL